MSNDMNGNEYDRQCEAADIRQAEIEQQAIDLLTDKAEVERLFMDYPLELGAICFTYCHGEPQALKNAMRSFLKSALVNEIKGGYHE